MLISACLVARIIRSGNEATRVPRFVPAMVKVFSDVDGESERASDLTSTDSASARLSTSTSSSAGVPSLLDTQIASTARSELARKPSIYEHLSILTEHNIEHNW